MERKKKKLCGGTQQLSEGLATFVKKSGGEILLDHVVNSISQNEKGVTVKCRNGTVFKSKYVCIAIPPTLASRIEYEPALPYTRDGITQRIPMGSIIKTHTYYEKPFWREKGFSGQIVSDKGPVCATFDDCCYDGKSYFGIMGFVLSNDAMEFRKKNKERTWRGNCRTICHPISNSRNEKNQFIMMKKIGARKNFQEDVTLDCFHLEL